MDEDVKRYMKHGFRYILNILIIVELLSLFHYIFITLGVVTPLENVAGYEEQLFEVFRPAASILMLVLLFSWIMLFRKQPIRTQSSQTQNFDINIGRIMTFLMKNSLMIAVLLSIIGAIYPWSPYINPDHNTFGVDARGYKQFYNEEFVESTVIQIQRRMGLKLPIYVIHVLFNLDYDIIIDYIPVIINPLLVFSVYFMVDKVCGDRTLAGLSALTMSMGFNITVGMYSYFLGNNIGLVYMFISLGYLIKDLQSGDGYTNPASVFFGCLVIFTHPWVLYQFYGTLLLFLSVLYLRKRDLRSISPLVVYIAVLGVVYFYSKLLIPSYEVVSNESNLVVENFFRPQDFVASNLFTFTRLYTGLMGNSFFLFMSLLGVQKLDRDNFFDVFLWCLLFATSFVYVFSNMTFPSLNVANYIPSRLIYNLPLCYLSSHGCKWILEHPAMKSLNTRIVWFFLSSMSVYLFRALFNMV